jgi:hypothetical protein
MVFIIERPVALDALLLWVRWRYEGQKLMRLLVAGMDKRSKAQKLYALHRSAGNCCALTRY